MPLRSQDPLFLHGDQVATTSTAGEEAGAMFVEAAQSGPIGALWRMATLDEAENGIADDPMTLSRTGRRTGRGPDSPLVSQSDALARIKAEGMDGLLQVEKAGIRSRALDILIARKRAEQRRQTILQQSPGGAGRVSARVAASLAGSLVDPSNVALAFVPAVGEARYAAMLARAGGLAGRTGVRIGVGGAEGLVGAAIAEPLNYAANLQQQADYDAYDAMLNIGGGAFFGAALHGGAGLFGDAIRPGRWAPRRELAPDATGGAASAPLPDATTRTVEAPRAPEIDVAARERAIVLDRLREGRPLTRDHATAQAMDNLRADIEADLLAQASGVADRGVVAAARAELTAVTRELDGLDAAQRQRVKDFNAHPGVTRKQAEAMAAEQQGSIRADLETRKVRAEAQIAANKAGSDAQAALSAFRNKGEVPDAWRAQIDAEADRLLGSNHEQTLSAAVTKAIADDPFRGVRPGIATLPADVQQGAMRAALAQALTGRPVDVTPTLFGHYGDLQAATDAALRNAGEQAGADRVAAQAADVRLAEARTEDIAAQTEAANDAEATLREMARQAELPDEDLATMMEAGEVAMKEAKQRVSAFKIAALCALRAG